VRLCELIVCNVYAGAKTYVACGKSKGLPLRPPRRADVAFLIQPTRLGTKEPRPTVARGTGRCTDLAFPDAYEERQERGEVVRSG